MIKCQKIGCGAEIKMREADLMFVHTSAPPSNVGPHNAQVPLQKGPDG